MNRDELLKQLEKIPLARLQSASFKALLRAQVYFTGRTHEVMLDYLSTARGAILKAGGKDGVLDDAVNGFTLQSDLIRMWGDAWSEWQAEFQQMRREAGKIAFGVQAVSHERLVSPVVSKLQVEGQRLEIGNQQAMYESRITDGVYDPQLRILMEIAAQYVYGDGINLSDRVWRIDRDARETISQLVINAVSNGASAFDLAKQLEDLLGAGQDCPRWTSSRLYGTTKKEIAAGNTRGLFSGNDCDGQGVSYKALRLARTEIQKIHALATDRMMAMQPWVEQEKVNLSAAHGEADECDDVVNGGEKGDGVYAVGTIELPLHPQCMCYKTAVLMDREAFVSRMRDWLNGGSWSEMDAYANDLGVPLESDLMPAAINLAVWLFGDALKDWLN